MTYSILKELAFFSLSVSMLSTTATEVNESVLSVLTSEPWVLELAQIVFLKI